MKKEDFVARYILAGVGLTTTENAIWMAQDAWQVYEEWLAKEEGAARTARRGKT